MVLNINNNQLFNNNFVNFNRALSKLDKGAQKLTTGLKNPTAADGVATRAIAAGLRTTIVGTTDRNSSLQNGLGYAQLRGEYLTEVRGLVDRMIALAQSAQDPIKNTGDRDTLNSEFRAIADEIRSFDTINYNGISLMDDGDITLLTGVFANDTYVVSTLSYASLTFTDLGGAGGLSIDQDSFANLASVITRLETRAGSVDVMLANTGSDINVISRQIDLNNAYMGFLSNTESQLKNVDVAMELADFTTNQLTTNIAESILAQTIDIHAGLVGRFI